MKNPFILLFIFITFQIICNENNIVKDIGFKINTFDSSTPVENIKKPLSFYLNRAGYGMAGGGVGLILVGSVIFITDNIFFPYVMDINFNSHSISKYDEYQSLYFADLTLFITGLSILSLGVCLLIPAIILMVYKDKDKKVSMYLETSSLSLGVRFNF